MVRLTKDARALLTAWFLNPKTTVDVGGATAKSRLTDRSKAALANLEAAGYVTVEQITPDGRMRYSCTGKTGGRLPLDEMENHGGWSPTEPNPDASEHAKAQSTMTLHFSSGRQALEAHHEQ